MFPVLLSYSCSFILILLFFSVLSIPKTLFNFNFNFFLQSSTSSSFCSISISIHLFHLILFLFIYLLTGLLNHQFIPIFIVHISVSTFFLVCHSSFHHSFRSTWWKHPNIDFKINFQYFNPSVFTFCCLTAFFYASDLTCTTIDRVVSFYQLLLHRFLYYTVFNTSWSYCVCPLFTIISLIPVLRSLATCQTKRSLLFNSTILSVLPNYSYLILSVSPALPSSTSLMDICFVAYDRLSPSF